MQLIFATSFVSERVTYALSWTLLHSLWQGVVLALVAGVLMWWGRKKPASLRYNLLSLLLLGFVLTVGVTFGLEWQFQMAQVNGKGMVIHYLQQDLGALIATKDGSIGLAKILVTWQLAALGYLF